MNKRFERIEYLIKPEGLQILQQSTVAVIGVGGVGGVAVEALARSGVGTLIIQDFDVVDITNINRQIIANDNTIGKVKVDVLANKLQEINPNIKVIKIANKYGQESKMTLFSHKIDFLIDAIDDIKAKYELICNCISHNINFISSMGAAKKLSPFNIIIDDIRKTSYDPIAKIIRKKLRDDKITSKVMVAYSKEKPQEIPNLGSYMPVTASFGLVCAHYCIMQLLQKGGIK